ncbi:MAG: ACT domain-containing protein [Oscillospiraceae bacterium]|nr:ACT domain-containing protein [Oscillospiraceae bacterium]
MAQQPKYYLVEATALPEIFLKVAEAKRMLQTGEVSTVHDAAKMMDISRSAFYKYRDSIFPFQNMMAGRIITFQMILRDMPGLLSSILTIFAQCGANILTINQTIPTNDCASVTISSETMGLHCPVEELLRKISEQPGVVRADILAG